MQIHASHLTKAGNAERFLVVEYYLGTAPPLSLFILFINSYILFFVMHQGSLTMERGVIHAVAAAPLPLSWSIQVHSAANTTMKIRIWIWNRGSKAK